MPLFQDVGKKFADAAKIVSKRTAEATEVVRLNGRIAGMQGELEQLFNQIGKAYYAMRDKSGDSEAAAALCQQVDKLQADIEQAKKSLDQLRNVSRCPSCGELQNAQAQFCASCGAKMPAPPPPPVEDEVMKAVEGEARPAGSPDVEINWPKPDAPLIGGEADGDEAEDEAPKDE